MLLTSTPTDELAIERLANAGIPLGSQSVLLAGVNDCPNLFRELVHKLAANRIRPYYLYQCDPVFGSQQFRTPIDSPAGGGKIPVAPDYLISRSSKKIVLRNFEGMYATTSSLNITSGTTRILADIADRAGFMRFYRETRIISRPPGGASPATSRITQSSYSG